MPINRVFNSRVFLNFRSFTSLDLRLGGGLGFPIWNNNVWCCVSMCERVCVWNTLYLTFLLCEAVSECVCVGFMHQHMKWVLCGRRWITEIVAIVVDVVWQKETKKKVTPAANYIGSRCGHFVAIISCHHCPSVDIYKLVTEWEGKCQAQQEVYRG